MSVRIFDAGEAAREASWAGAGMLAPGGEIESPSAFAAAALNSLQAYPDFVGELEEETGRNIDFRRSGAVELAFNDEERDELNQKSLRQTEIGIPSESCSHNGFPARYYPDDAVVDPRDVNQALLTACERRGVAIHQHEPVLDISPDGRRVRTTKDEYGTEGVLIAAGAWSSALLPGLPQTTPVRGHLISWRLNPGLLGPILRHGRTYLLQRRSGVLIAGASTERVGFDRALDKAAVNEIHSRAAVLMPELREQIPTECWNGFRPGMDSGNPNIGRVAGTAIWTAYGHYRNGILLAPETARQISALIP